jgi:hypothetical protein
MPDFINEPAFEIGRRVEIRGAYAWFVVLKPANDSELALENFAAELSAVLEMRVRVIDFRAYSFEEIREGLNAPPKDPVLIFDLDHAGNNDWQTLDINRSGLLREGPVVFWLSPRDLTRLCEHAPNIRSFVGGSIFALSTHGDELTPAERQQRISDLEAHFVMASAEVIARAESGTLPTEPHFVEWLVRLGARPDERRCLMGDSILSWH